MKKIKSLSMLLFLMLMASSQMVFSQKGLRVGVQAAPLLTVTFNGDDVQNESMDYKAKTSNTIGITSSYFITEKFGLGVEVMYSKERQEYKDQNISYSEKWQYLKIPVLAHFNSNPRSKLMFTAKAGPQVGILLKSATYNSTDPAKNGATTERYNRFHIGAMAGLGAAYQITSSFRAAAGLRFDGSISSLEDKEAASYLPGRSNTHNLNAGLEFGLQYLLH